MSKELKSSELAGANEKGIRLIEQLEPCEYDRVLSIVSCFLQTHDTRLSDDCISKVMYCKELNINDITRLVSVISRIRNVRAGTFFNNSASLYYVEHPEVVESYKRDIAIDDSIIFKLSVLLSGLDIEQSDVTEEPQEQEREEQVKYKLTFYYDDGTSVSAFVSDALSSHFISSGDGVVFNLHQSYMDMGHKNGTVFNVFNFPNADKICTIDVSFLPPDYDDDNELPF